MIRYSFVLLSVAVALSNAQEVGDNPPPILIQAEAFGVDSVIDIMKNLQSNIDKAQANLDSLTPVSTFTSAAHRAAFYKAASDMKKANVALYSYMAGCDPNNRLSWIQKARQSKRQAEVAMAEYYKALPSEDLTIQHPRQHLDVN